MGNLFTCFKRRRRSNSRPEEREGINSMTESSQPPPEENIQPTDIKKSQAENNPTEKSFMLFARDLSIAWGDNASYWQWKKLKEVASPNEGDEQIEVAELLRVCWLEVSGKYDLSNLSPETDYDVMFVIMLKDPASGWEVPVNFKLVLPDGTKFEIRQNLMQKPNGRWIEIPVGELKPSIFENSGTIEFSMYETEHLHWKGGLVVKGVRILPKK